MLQERQTPTLRSVLDVSPLWQEIVQEVIRSRIIVRAAYCLTIKNSRNYTATNIDEASPHYDSHQTIITPTQG